MTETYDILPFVPAVPLSQQPSVLAYLKALGTQQRIGQLQRISGSSGLSEHGQQLLALKPANPYAPVVKLWARIGVAGVSAQMAICNELKQLEMAIFEDVRIGRADVALMGLLKKGWQHLEKEPPAGTHNDTLAHDHAKNWIRLDLQRQGYEASCEYPVPGDRTHYADVGCKIDGQLHVCEVVYKSHANVILHLSACFLESEAVAVVTVVAFTKIHLAKLRKLVDAEPSLRPFADRIRWDVIEGYLRRVYPS